MMNRVEMNEKMMEQVYGGYFYIRNAIAEERYNQCGIKTCYHNMAKDEFWLPNGQQVDEKTANLYVYNQVGETVFKAWCYEHYNDGKEIVESLLN